VVRLTTLVAGVLVALVVYLRAGRPARSAAGLVVGGVLGSLVAWRTGAMLRPDSLLSTAAGLKVGARFEDARPLGVRRAAPGRSAP
jgi:hypothetical protein